MLFRSDLVVFDNLLNKAFLITHINPDEQTFNEALDRLTEISEQIKQPIAPTDYQSDNIHSEDFISVLEKTITNKRLKTFNNTLLLAMSCKWFLRNDSVVNLKHLPLSSTAN